MSSDMIILDVKRHFQLRAIEWWSAGAMASWGILVSLLPGMFQNSPPASALLHFAPQHVWGLVALLAGVLRLCALFVNGLWYRTPAVRWVTAMVGVCIWFSIAAAFASNMFWNTAVIMYGWHMIADMYSAYRSATDFIEAQTERRLKLLQCINTPGESHRAGANVSSFPSRQR